MSRNNSIIMSVRNVKKAFKKKGTGELLVLDHVDFDVKENVIIKRLSGRLICKNCGAIYHKIDSIKAGLQQRRVLQEDEDRKRKDSLKSRYDNF